MDMDDRNAMALPVTSGSGIFFKLKKPWNEKNKPSRNQSNSKQQQTHSFVCFVSFLICSWDSVFFDSCSFFFSGINLGFFLLLMSNWFIDGWAHFKVLQVYHPRGTKIANSSPQEGTISKARWWFQIFFIFTPIWGNDPIWRAYFSNGLVQPPTRKERIGNFQSSFLSLVWRFVLPGLWGVWRHPQVMFVPGLFTLHLASVWLADCHRLVVEASNWKWGKSAATSKNWRNSGMRRNKNS